MMKSEFIERTGFEPTADEYREIEQEYMGCDIDKDQFCKEWKKNGGIQRLMRLRARRIEELEAEVQKRAREYDELDATRCTQVLALEKTKNEKISKLENDIKMLRRNWEEADRQLADANARAVEAERKLAVLSEAFAILGFRKEVEK